MTSRRLMVGLVGPVLALGLLTFSGTLWSAAHHPVAEAHAYQGWFAGRPQGSTLGTPNDGQEAVARGATGDSEPTPTPSSTPPPGTTGDSELTPTPSSTPPPDTTGDSEWRLVIDGFVQTPLSLTYDDLVAMPPDPVYARLYCVGRPKIPLTEGNWNGVRLGLLLEEAGVSPEAVKVAFYASDGYSTDLTVTTAMRSDVIIAYEQDGKPVPGTVRLVIPGKWGYKWIQWLTHIELVNYDFLGVPESTGLSDEADIPGYFTTTVGGIQELPDVAGASTDDSASDGSRIPVPAEVAAAFAAAVVALGVGGWYARRRWHNARGN